MSDCSGPDCKHHSHLKTEGAENGRIQTVTPNSANLAEYRAPLEYSENRQPSGMDEAEPSSATNPSAIPLDPTATAAQPPTGTQVPISRHQRALLEEWQTSHPDTPPPFQLTQDGRAVWINRRARRAMKALERRIAKDAR